jgi:hypothetical protein
VRSGIFQAAIRPARQCSPAAAAFAERYVAIAGAYSENEAGLAGTGTGVAVGAASAGVDDATVGVVTDAILVRLSHAVTRSAEASAATIHVLLMPASGYSIAAGGALTPGSAPGRRR